MIYRKFKIDQKIYSELSQDEKEVVAILEDTVKDTADLYEQQVKDGFYPRKITKEEIEKAAIKKPLILSPFSYVFEKDGELDTLPYHKKYTSLLQPIAQKIEKAARLSQNPSFKRYLKARAKSLLDGSYKEADIAWFNVRHSKIDFTIGLFERYLDQVLFIKRSYQAHVGIINTKATTLAEQIKDTLYSSAKLSFDRYHSTDIPQKGVSVLVEDTPLTAGYMADVIFSGEHFPSDLDVMQKYGSKILIYLSQMRLKFNMLHHPIFKALFEKKFASKYSKEMLCKATRWNILLYELSRQLHKFPGARQRLKELYGPIDEANGFASGIQHAKYLVVKGLISQDELEAIIIIHIVWMFSDWIAYQKNKGLRSYVLGNAIALNSYLLSGAIKEKGGISWPNFPKIFFEIEALAESLVHLLRIGTYKEAKKFIKEKADLSSFERLSKNLKSFKCNI